MSKKSLPFLLLLLLGQMLTDLNNICQYCSWENLQTNDLFPYYNIQFIYEYYVIEKQKISVCFQYCHFVLSLCQFLAAFFENLFHLQRLHLLFRNSLISLFYSTVLKTCKFSIKIRSSSLKPVFTPNHWHQTVVCYQATRVRYPNKQVSKLTKEAGLSFITRN